MRKDRPARQRQSRCARCGAMAALYMRKRRLTTNAAATVTATGEWTAMSWLAMSWAMPEKEKTESARPWAALMPAATAATPATKPNGTVPRSTGSISRQPARNALRGVASGKEGSGNEGDCDSRRAGGSASTFANMKGMKRIVLLRHGESAWNQENRFTGWTDVDLAEKGIEEARAAGRLLKREGFDFDFAFTSVLKRAIRTLNFALEEMDRLWIPVEKDWRLNERHYGALQGLDKAETAAKYGEEQVLLWRRSYDVPP